MARTAAARSLSRDGFLDESQVLPTVEEVTGQAPHTFREWALEHADKF